MRINSSKTAYPDKNQKFLERLMENLPIAWKIDGFQHCKYTMLESRPMKRRYTRTKSSLKKSWLSMLRSSALVKFKRDPNHQNLQRLWKLLEAKPAKPHVAAQKTTDNIQHVWINGNTRNMYGGIKQATGKPTKKSAPLKSKIGKLITQDKIPSLKKRLMLLRAYQSWMCLGVYQSWTCLGICQSWKCSGVCQS